MLSMQDVIDYCDLERGEIEAIAEHEHIPLLCTPQGVYQLHSVIIENMQHALEVGEYQHVKDLAATYAHLQRTHPIASEVN